MDHFESPKYLVSQTRENMAEFKTIYDSLFSGVCYSSVVDVDPKTGNKTYKIKFNRPIPNRARHIAATAISDLKHALDQAFTTSVRLVTGNDPGLIYFPFATNPTDLEGRFNIEAYKNVPEKIRAVIRDVKPYPSGTSYKGGSDLLCRLSKTAGPNKHNVTCKVVGRIIRLNNDNIHGTKLIRMGLPPRWDVDKNELIIGVTEPDGEIQYKFDLTFYIALYEAGPLTGAPVLETAIKLADTIEPIIANLEAASS